MSDIHLPSVFNAAFSTQESTTSEENSSIHWHQTPGMTLAQELAQERVVMMQDNLAETLENMSLTLGAKIKSFQLSGDTEVDPDDVSEINIDLEILHLLDVLSHRLTEQQQQRLRDLQSSLLTHKNPLQYLLESGLSPLETAIALAQAIAYLDPEQSKRLKQALYELLTQQGEYIAAAMAGFSELPAPRNEMAALQQQILQQPISLVGLFNTVKKKKNRKKYVKMIIASLALQMTRTLDAELDNQLLHLLDEMRRLLLLLGFEERAEIICHNINHVGGCNCQPDELIELLLSLLENVWFHTDYFASELQRLGIVDIPVQIVATQRISEMLQFLPEVCFTDADQKRQILESMRAWIHELSDAE